MSAKKVVTKIFSWIGKSISFVRIALINLVFIVSIGVLFLTLQRFQPAPLPESGVLWLNPTGQIVEQYSFNDPLLAILSPEQVALETTLSDIIRAIRLAKDDDRIKAIVIDPDAITGIGISSINSIHKAIDEFRESEKPVYAYSRGMRQHQYLLASAADQIVIHPMSYVAISGYGAYREYYKSALDKLLIDVHVFRVGEYKSAMEPYMRDSMSTEAANANKAWLDGLWSYYTGVVSQNREISPGDIDDYVNKMVAGLTAVDGDTAEFAKASELVDGLGTSSDFWAFLRERIPSLTKEESASVSLSSYLASTMTLPSAVEGDAVAIVTVEGTIVDGEAPPGSAAGDSVAALLKSARKDPNIKAVVLRVNSPGGSAFASEIIREQVLALKDAGKPVVVSMANMAASGGYWISANADEIWASPTTLTGSIGIFAAVPDFHRALQKLGVHSDGVGTTNVADGLAIARPLNPHLKQGLQLAIEHGYERFIDLVATGRNMSDTAAREVAEGRVWTGADALRVGLVDQLGELDDAVKSAAYLGGIEGEPAVIRVQDPKWAQLGVLQRLFSVVATAWQPSNQSFAYLEQLAEQALPSWLVTPDRRNLYLHCNECDVIQAQ